MSAPGRMTARHRTRLAISLGCLAAVAAACVPLAPPPIYSANPTVRNVNFADPAVVNVGDGTFRAFSTNAIYGDTFWPRAPVATAAALGPGSWSLGSPPDALPEPFPAVWQRPDERHRFWAPAVHQFGSTWVMYYTAPHASAPDQCVGVATSTTVDGPYQPLGSVPFVCDFGNGGSIDPSVVVEPGGQPWLLWKNDGNCCNLPTYIWSRPLTDDGLGFEADARPILRVNFVWEDGSQGGLQPWKRLIEGPTMIERNGKYWLFYSANWWDSAQYAVGFAVCSSPGSPCGKPTGRPLVGTGPYGAGPGGPSVVADTGGQLWLAYHAWAPSAVGVASGGWRSLRFSRLDLDAGGIPVLGPGP